MKNLVVGVIGAPLPLDRRQLLAQRQHLLPVLFAQLHGRRVLVLQRVHAAP